ncbi:putative metal-binding hydrolase [Candidatus Filomicrobium marinum]|uniref:Putative metal-binding hydrolase n=1 Tax=Candidatus Filomicrobium marinum TaxID=1608628 RepID=A0A0D6JHH8_9HYPH|nr:MBL fold metallo-hydrolase [Candidatus Filomicrobium marinum]CFX49855.1 putative metal-binding hydrolase [Candidatus Filomicrobium marinum]CPR20290.1 putative metal-binding hydrolase [Candidatus Filomicrobium marinum]
MTDTKPSLKAAILQVTPFQQNCSLIWDEATGVGAVVDPGGDIDRIEDAISEVGMKPEKILLTHGHIDHAGGADELREKLGVKIEGPHRADEFLLQGLESQGREYGFSARNVTPDRWLSEGDQVTVAGHNFDIMHCPGHSPGSVVFINQPHKFGLFGDVLFRGSIGRTDFPYGDHDALISAIKTKLLPLGDNFAFICGHGPGSTIGLERNANPFLT